MDVCNLRQILNPWWHIQTCLYHFIATVKIFSTTLSSPRDSLNRPECFLEISPQYFVLFLLPFLFGFHTFDLLLILLRMVENTLLHYRVRVLFIELQIPIKSTRHATMAQQWLKVKSYDSHIRHLKCII